MLVSVYSTSSQSVLQQYREVVFTYSRIQLEIDEGIVVSLYLSVVVTAENKCLVNSEVLNGTTQHLTL